MATIDAEEICMPDYWELRLIEFEWRIYFLTQLILLDTNKSLIQTVDRSGNVVVCLKSFYLLEDCKINESQFCFELNCSAWD